MSSASTSAASGTFSLVPPPSPHHPLYHESHRERETIQRSSSDIFLAAKSSLPGANPFGSVGPDQAVFGLAIFLGGAAQLAAGVMQFRVGNTFGTTLHCCYGAFWLSYAMFLVPSLGIRAAYAGEARAYAVALGVYLVMWCLLTLIFFFGALRTNLVILGVLGCLAVAFFLLAVATFINTTHPAASVRRIDHGGISAPSLISLYIESCCRTLQHVDQIIMVLGVVMLASVVDAG